MTHVGNIAVMGMISGASTTSVSQRHPKTMEIKIAVTKSTGRDTMGKATSIASAIIAIASPANKRTPSRLAGGDAAGFTAELLLA